MIPLPKRAFLPVIHVVGLEQAKRNAAIALTQGAHGFFLISHGSLKALELLRIQRELRNFLPRAWIGINFLDLVPEQIFGFIKDDISGLWVDDVGLKFAEQTAIQVMQRRLVLRREWNGLYFGGVAFKHQPVHSQLGEPPRQAKIAAPFLDVITTSGVATGIAPDVQKIREMKLAVPEKPLAIASGLTPENAHEFLPYADHFLVATGISDTFTELNPNRVRQFADIIRSVP